jgi:hypothetical protein
MKKKKIKYGGIPKKVLNIVVGDDYFNGDYTLKSELDKYGEDIIVARYELVDEDYIRWFQAWTKNYVMILIDDMMGSKIILGLLREVPHELKK